MYGRRVPVLSAGMFLLWSGQPLLTEEVIRMGLSRNEKVMVIVLLAGTLLVVLNQTCLLYTSDAADD